MKYELIRYEHQNPKFELMETKRISVAGAEFDESFLVELLRDYFAFRYLSIDRLSPF
jgi:hypothetical protein